MAFWDIFRRRFAGAFFVPEAASGIKIQNGTLASNETIFSAISMLANAIASLPLELKKDFRRVEPGEHPVAALLEWSPCPNLSTFQFIRCMETLRDCTGAGYAVKELDKAGGVQALWLMKTECVEPVIDRGGRELYYRIRDEYGGEISYIHHSMLLAVSHIGTDGITPINPIDVLRSSLDYDRQVKEFSVDQMKGGLRAKCVINFKSALNKEQINKFNETLSVFKRSGILYLDPGKSLQELRESSIIDPKVFEVENITISRVARVYNIPLDKFLPEKTSYSSAEQGDLNYLRDTVLPMARMYEQEFTKKLLSPQDREKGLCIKFSLNGLNGFARADMKTRGDYYQKAIRSGWMCLDEVRAFEDFPPVPGGLGAIFFVSRDLTPVRQAALESEKRGELL